jgi:dGTPase
VDEIAYNNHDIDDGLTSGMFTVDHIREVTLFRDAHEAVLRARITDERIVQHEVIRRIIDRCARDLTDSTLAQIRAAKVESIAGVRTAGKRLVSYTAEMARHVRELKDFLYKNMYRHYRVVRMGDKAGRILRDLFASYVGEPLQLPPRFQERIPMDGVHRVVCDYIAGMTDRFALDEHRKLFDPLVRV